MASGDQANTNPKDTEPSASPSPQSKKDRDAKGKAGSSKKMSQKEQSERFKRAAEDLEIDTDHSTEFDRAMKVIVRRKS